MNDTFQVNNSKSFSKQVCHSCRLDKMAGTPRGMPFQAVLLTFDLISEFTHFDLVIRLIKVKQSFTFQVSPSLSPVEQPPAVSGIHLL